ncbi:MAG: hypothetical protein SNJ77_00870 [Cytophagales bacterium]
MNKKFVAYFGLFVSILYVLMGAYVLAFGQNQFKDNIRFLIGGLLIAYGIFRLYRLQKSWPKN